MLFDTEQIGDKDEILRMKSPHGFIDLARMLLCAPLFQRNCKKARKRLVDATTPTKPYEIAPYVKFTEFRPRKASPPQSNSDSDADGSAEERGNRDRRGNDGVVEGYRRRRSKSPNRVTWEQETGGRTWDEREAFDAANDSLYPMRKELEAMRVGSRSLASSKPWRARIARPSEWESVKVWGGASESKRTSSPVSDRTRALRDDSEETLTNDSHSLQDQRGGSPRLGDGSASTLVDETESKWTRVPVSTCEADVPGDGDWRHSKWEGPVVYVVSLCRNEDGDGTDATSETGEDDKREPWRQGVRYDLEASPLGGIPHQSRWTSIPISAAPEYGMNDPPSEAIKMQYLYDVGCPPHVPVLASHSLPSKNWTLGRTYPYPEHERARETHDLFKWVVWRGRFDTVVAYDGRLAALHKPPPDPRDQKYPEVVYAVLDRRERNKGVNDGARTDRDPKIAEYEDHVSDNQGEASQESLQGDRSTESELSWQSRRQRRLTKPPESALLYSKTVLTIVTKTADTSSAIVKTVTVRADVAEQLDPPFRDRMAFPPPQHPDARVPLWEERVARPGTWPSIPKWRFYYDDVEAVERRRRAASTDRWEEHESETGFPEHSEAEVYPAQHVERLAVRDRGMNAEDAATNASTDALSDTPSPKPLKPKRADLHVIIDRDPRPSTSTVGLGSEGFSPLETPMPSSSHAATKLQRAERELQKCNVTSMGLFTEISWLAKAFGLSAGASMALDRYLIAKLDPEPSVHVLITYLHGPVHPHIGPKMQLERDVSGMDRGARIADRGSNPGTARSKKKSIKRSKTNRNSSSTKQASSPYASTSKLSPSSVPDSSAESLKHNMHLSPDIIVMLYRAVELLEDIERVDPSKLRSHEEEFTYILTNPCIAELMIRDPRPLSQVLLQRVVEMAKKYARGKQGSRASR
ncbi:hypothetical protein HDU96_009833 [Phlyctochytrium bullatum]|nr:hypothetical protein HDU96_009833 [Phlyctochytrium bullatum]